MIISKKEIIQIFEMIAIQLNNVILFNKGDYIIVALNNKINRTHNYIETFFNNITIIIVTIGVICYFLFMTTVDIELPLS